MSPRKASVPIVLNPDSLIELPHPWGFNHERSSEIITVLWNLVVLRLSAGETAHKIFQAGNINTTASRISQTLAEGNAGIRLLGNTSLTAYHLIIQEIGRVVLEIPTSGQGSIRIRSRPLQPSRLTTLESLESQYHTSKDPLGFGWASRFTPVSDEPCETNNQCELQPSSTNDGAGVGTARPTNQSAAIPMSKNTCPAPSKPDTQAGDTPDETVEVMDSSSDTQPVQAKDFTTMRVGPLTIREKAAGVADVNQFPLMPPGTRSISAKELRRLERLPLPALCPRCRNGNARLTLAEDWYSKRLVCMCGMEIEIISGDGTLPLDPEEDELGRHRQRRRQPSHGKIRL